MTDKTNDPAMQAAIENLAAAGADDSNTRVATPQPNLKYNSATGEVEQSGPSVDATIPERGVVPEVEIAKIQDNLNALTAKYNAETDHAKKEILGQQLGRAIEAAEYDVQRLSALSAQREAKARADEAAANEKLAAAMFSNGDAARATALKAALLAEEARLAAQTIVATRAEGIKQGRR